ncbi:MAG: hypothetical protein ACQEP2_01915 [Actinomycetota bacterium]
MPNKKKTFITIISIIIILFGLGGTVLSIGGILILDSREEDFKDINNLVLAVSGSLEEVTEILQTSNETTENVAETIRTTKNTISYTSEITYDSGMAFKEVAGMVGFEILGFKPLKGAEGYFSDIGSNLIVLSEELELVQDNLKTNVSDIERVGEDLVNISEELENVSTLFNKIINTYSIFKFVSIIKYLLIYSGILNIMFILNGIMFLLLGR